MSSSDTATGFAMGFVLGAAIGLAIGFLYAPQPGEETREMLKERAGDVRERAAGVVEKVRETTAAAKQKAQEKLGRDTAGQTE